MTTRYQKRHYEDVARLLNKQPIASVGSLRQAIKRMVEDFAGLFAADNPPYCTNCGAPAITNEVCVSAGGRPYDGHLFEGGFDREQFLAACGLEPEGSDTCGRCGKSQQAGVHYPNAVVGTECPASRLESEG